MSQIKVGDIVYFLKKTSKRKSRRKNKISSKKINLPSYVDDWIGELIVTDIEDEEFVRAVRKGDDEEILMFENRAFFVKKSDIELKNKFSNYLNKNYEATI